MLPSVGSCAGLALVCLLASTWTTSATAASCGDAMAGYFFHALLDHAGDDIACARGGQNWTILEQANVCRANPACAGFNVDGYGSCLKTSATPLAAMVLVGVEPDACFGFYTKAQPPACGDAVPGYVFHALLDHNKDDIACARGAENWTIAGQADACRADPACAGFNVDSLGSCRKAVATPLAAMLGVGAEVDPCYGFYTKAQPPAPLAPAPPLPALVSACGAAVPGYVFNASMDHLFDDISCMRANVWSIAGQADACRADPTCAGFNVDSYGSCLKTSATPLEAMEGADAEADPCFGFYTKGPAAAPPAPPSPPPGVSACGDAVPGYVFNASMDHDFNDILCVRATIWSISGQADACRADPTCAGFNVDSYGSCLKTSATPLQAMEGAGAEADPCFGFYTKGPPAGPLAPTPPPPGVTACGDVVPGYVFNNSLDHIGDDLSCDRGGGWTTAGQADMCQADPACAGFNVDVFGSCRKTSAAPLAPMFVTGAEPDPCYGFYTKAQPPALSTPMCAKMGMTDAPITSVSLPTCLNFYPTGPAIRVPPDSDTVKYGVLVGSMGGGMGGGMPGMAGAASFVDRSSATWDVPGSLVFATNGFKDLDQIIVKVTLVDGAIGTVVPLLYVPLDTVVRPYAKTSFIGTLTNWDPPPGVSATAYVRWDFNQTIVDRGPQRVLQGRITNLFRPVRDVRGKCRPALCPASSEPPLSSQNQLGSSNCAWYRHYMSSTSLSLYWDPAMHGPADSELVMWLAGGISYMFSTPRVNELLADNAVLSKRYQFTIHGNPIGSLFQFSGDFAKRPSPNYC